MSRSTKSRIVVHPPRLGTRSLIVLRLLRRDTARAWPLSEIQAHSGLNSDWTDRIVRQLLELGLAEKRSGDTWIRVILTPAGRRYHL